MAPYLNDPDEPFRDVSTFLRCSLCVPCRRRSPACVLALRCGAQPLHALIWLDTHPSYIDFSLAAKYMRSLYCAFLVRPRAAACPR